MNLGRRLNRNCLSDGELRSAVDNGVDGPPELGQHLRACARCRQRMEKIVDNARFADRRLDMLGAGDTPADLNRAQQQIRRKIALSSQPVRATQGESLVSTMWRFRAARGAVAMLALILLTTAFVVTPMRSLADDIFNRFRVEKFEAITVNAGQFTEFSSSMLVQAMSADTDRLMASFEGLATLDSTFDQDNPQSNVVDLGSMQDAQAEFGDFKTPDNLPSEFSADPEIKMSQAGSITATVDTAAANAIVDELGLPIYSLPDASDVPQMVFEVDLPQALIMDYKAGDSGHIAVVQLESPTLTTPESIDMNALREDVLMLPGLPTDLVAQLRSIDDWQNTLIIPVPEGAETSDVTVDGEPGLLIEAGEFDGSQLGMDFQFDGDASVVMWHEGDNLYVVAGTVSGSELMDVADSLS